jgi:hypothetical protein
MAAEAGFTDIEWAGIGDNRDPFVLIAKKQEDQKNDGIKFAPE